jgi:hypothetical protein
MLVNGQPIHKQCRDVSLCRDVSKLPFQDKILRYLFLSCHLLRGFGKMIVLQEILAWSGKQAFENVVLS